MKSFLYLLAGVAVVLAASKTYQINYDVQQAEMRVSKLLRQIDKEREAIAVLEVEWAYLSRPERLRALAFTYYDELGLDKIYAENFGDISEVPMPPDEIGQAVRQIVARMN